MNCGLCSEYCPFDAIKMDQNFELSNYERHQTHIFSLQDLLVSSEYLRQDPSRGLEQRRGGGRARQGGQEEGPAAAKGAFSQQGCAGCGKTSPSTGQGLIDRCPSRLGPPADRAACREYTSQAETSCFEDASSHFLTPPSPTRCHDCLQLCRPLVKSRDNDRP